MFDKQKFFIELTYWDFPNYFPNNKWYIFIHKKNENKKLINICKSRKIKDYDIYIKDKDSATRYFQILLNGKFYIQNDYWTIKKDDIEKECKNCWTDFWKPSNFQEYSKYINICDIFYFDVIWLYHSSN